MSRGPISLAVHFAEIFEELGVTYAVGGSVASSLIGEPRSTMDVDMAARLDARTGSALLDLTGPEFYVPRNSAFDAIRSRSSFNLIDTASAMKVDIFVSGDGILDRHQLERRVRVEAPGTGRHLWVTSPEDQILRKLDWFLRGGSVSDRQWRDVVGVLRVRQKDLDFAHLNAVASSAGLSGVLAAALADAQEER